MNKKMMILAMFVLLVSAFVIGCGGGRKDGKGARSAEGVSIDPETGERIISEKARNAFEDAAASYRTAEEAGWTLESCASAIKAFEKVESKYGMIEASYNIGVIQRKCKNMPEAKAAFEATLKKDPKHQLSMTQLAVMELESGNEKRAEDLLRKAVGAGQSNLEAVPAYVNAATILRMRGKKNKDEGLFSKAELNLRRALAIESKYMPALYQLAMLYLDQAVTKKKSSFLTLAMLVCSQGIKLDPEYGPIYHVYGMVLLQKNRLVDALKAFETAFQKDKELFASYMNFGAINLNFRGYEEAKQAFEKAISLNPKSYEAHIGLGVALRGLGDFKGAKAEYEKASKIDPGRTDYIFNVGVLEMDYLNNGDVAGYTKAKGIFKKFLSKANKGHNEDPDGKGPELSWVAKAEKRVEQCDKNVKMIKEAEKEMAEMERLQAEQAKREAEMQAAMEKAKELEKKEEAGSVAPGEGGEAGEAAASAPVEQGAEKADDKAKDGAADKGKADAKDDGAKKDDKGKKTDAEKKK